MQYEPHPIIPGIIVLSRTVSMQGPSQARITCSYGVPSSPDNDQPSESPEKAQISVGSTTQSAETQVDQDDNQLFVSINTAV